MTLCQIEKLIRSIKRNLPTKYDLARLAESFIELLQKKTQIIISVSDDNTVKIWDTADGSVIHTLKGHTRSITHVALSPDGLRIVSGSRDETIKIWDAVNGSLLRTLTGHTGEVLNVIYSPDSLRIVSGGWDSTIKIWDAVNGSLLHTLTGILNWFRV